MKLDSPIPAARSEFPVAFGRYLLLKRLSRGGMGEIFLAKIGEIAGFEKFVIIKKILPQLAANDDFIVRFIDEAQVAIKLNHINIAQVYEVGRVDGEYFLAIEYIEGRDLRRLLRRCREVGRRLPVDQCVYVARDLAAGLAYAHRRTGPKGQALSLVHCDISPPNLMISYEGEIKVIDFGIARSALRTADSNPNIGFGKFGYMAPEQLLRGGLIDRRTDIYAAGVVLYELLTGERLYQFPEGTDYRAMARAVCQGKFTPPAQKDARIDPQLDAIVCKAIATRPEDRYQFAEEFRDALQQKLYQLNPTISTDTLSRTMDELFVGERQQEQDELNNLRAVDASAYKEELVGSVGHTVTFARALEEGLVQPQPGDATIANPPDEAPTTVVPTSGPMEQPPAVVVSGGLLAQAREGIPMSGKAAATASVPPLYAVERSRGASRLVLFGGAAFLLVFVGGSLFVLRDRIPGCAGQPAGRDKPIAITPPPPVPVAEPLPPQPKPVEEPKVEVPTPPPVVVEAPVAPPVKGPVKRPPTVGFRKPKPVPAQKLDPNDPVAIEKKRIEVDRKFQQVKAEYLEFKKNMGNRLEDRWQQILSDIALGRRDQGLSDALDHLRADMRKLRTQ